MKFIVSGLSALAFALLISTSPVTAQGTAFTPQQEKALGPLIKQYLLENPEVIFEAVDVFTQKNELAKAEAAKIVAETNADALFNNPSDPVGGNLKGDVTIVEFFDYNCAYCKKVFPDLMSAINEDGKVRIVFKEWPILGDSSVFAARAALAVLKQDKYMDFHMALMGNKGRLSEDIVMKLAGKVGLDIPKLKADMKSPDVDKVLEETTSLARTIGLTGTPGLVIGNQTFFGAISKQALVDAIAKARKSKS